MNMVQRAVQNGGRLAPLVIPKGLTRGTGLLNPSVFVDSGQILVNLRHCNYTLVHAEANQKFPTKWGPLAYLHPEKDQRLVTENYLCKLDDDLKMVDYSHVKMLDLHTPIWEFVGLEDARVVKWDNYFYLIGVRRDTTTNGQGRMEYSKLYVNWNRKEHPVKEVERVRIPVPGPEESYCEKNWVPVIDRPYHFVKWTAPTELVYADPKEEKTTTVFTKEVSPMPPKDQRGSSQVIKWGSMYVSITHEVDLFKNYLQQKDAIYRHRLCVWDSEFNFVGFSNVFSFLDFPIEFCCGAAEYTGDLLLTFGAADNAAFILQVPKLVVEDMVMEALQYAN